MEYLPNQSTKRSPIENIVLIGIFIFLLIGLTLAHLDHHYFKHQFVTEDGLIETLTVCALLMSASVYLIRITGIRKQNGGLFLIMMCLSFLVFFFAAGEEISWGQRIFNIQSHEFFMQNNAQQETNFHNLVVNGTKINKLVFSKILMLVAAFYLLILPALYTRKNGIRKWADKLGIPIPQRYQIIAFLIFLTMTELTFSSKKGELLEFFGTFLLFLIVTYPKNKQIFQRG